MRDHSAVTTTRFCPAQPAPPLTHHAVGDIWGRRASRALRANPFTCGALFTSRLHAMLDSKVRTTFTRSRPKKRSYIACVSAAPPRMGAVAPTGCIGWAAPRNRRSLARDSNGRVGEEGARAFARSRATRRQVSERAAFSVWRGHCGELTAAIRAGAGRLPLAADGSRQSAPAAPDAHCASVK